MIEQGYHETIDVEHGCIESRKYAQLAVTDQLEQRKGWANLQSVIAVERHHQDKQTGQESIKLTLKQAAWNDEVRGKVMFL